MITAKSFIDRMKSIESGAQGSISKIEIFRLAKESKSMPISEVIKLLKNRDYDQRVGAVAIMDWKARDKKTSEQEKEAVYKAYIENHKWIDDWALVDRAAPYVVGGFLFLRDRKPLYDLAKSRDPMERRTAIVATYYFIRQNQIDDTFRIAEILVNDEDEYVQKAVGSWIREAGKRNQEKLEYFLDKYAHSMPRITLRYAIEKLAKPVRQKYLEVKGSKLKELNSSYQ
jgi:3-methyladenine DNA glycosylase AlkD